MFVIFFLVTCFTKRNENKFRNILDVIKTPLNTTECFQIWNIRSERETDKYYSFNVKHSKSKSLNFEIPVKMRLTVLRQTNFILKGFNWNFRNIMASYARKIMFRSLQNGFRSNVTEVSLLTSYNLQVMCVVG